MSKRIVSCVGLAALLGFIGFAVVSASGQAPAPPALFAGKKVVVLSKSDPGGVTLEKAQVQVLGGRSFIVGQAVESEQKITRTPVFVGATHWVPVDDVSQLIELKGN
jgi:hypothetical protein